MKYYAFLLIAIISLFFTESYIKQDTELFYKFVQFSLILAGFALTAGIFYYKNSKNKKVSDGLFNSSYSFLGGGVLFIIFLAFFSFAQIWNPRHNLDISELSLMTNKQREQALEEYNQNRFSGLEIIILFVIFFIAVFSFVKGISLLFDSLDELGVKKHKKWYKF